MRHNENDDDDQTAAICSRSTSTIETNDKNKQSITNSTMKVVNNGTPTMSLSLVLLLLVANLGVATAFFGLKPATSAGAKSSPQTEEAIATFAKKYPFDRPPVKTSARMKFGMPYRDIDGTEVFKYRQRDPSTIGKRLTDISETNARAAFNTLAQLYGADEALQMVKADPVILAFQRENFKPCLDNWSEIFGEEESKAMVVRNPGLLAVKPADAAKATDQTMTFSYIVATTRPIGPFALPLLLLLLLTPAIESVSGIPIRTTFLSSLTGADPTEVAVTLQKVGQPIWKWF